MKKVKKAELAAMAEELKPVTKAADTIDEELKALSVCVNSMNACVDALSGVSEETRSRIMRYLHQRYPEVVAE